MDLNWLPSKQVNTRRDVLMLDERITTKGNGLEIRILHSESKSDWEKKNWFRFQNIILLSFEEKKIAPPRKQHLSYYACNYKTNWARRSRLGLVKFWIFYKTSFLAGWVWSSFEFFTKLDQPGLSSSICLKATCLWSQMLLAGWGNFFFSKDSRVPLVTNYKTNFEF